jgi:putative DNA primase/helicase
MSASAKSKKHVDRGRKVASPPETPEIAVSLARAGWPVFPVTIYEDASGKRHKVPAVKWKEWATTDLATIARAWSGEHSGRWIGVYAGAAGIVVLDVDPGGDDAIAAAGHEIPKTFNYSTHRKGGRHHVFAAPEGIELTIAKALLDGVDVRSGAGLMVYYGPALDKTPKLAPAPDWILVEKGESRAGGGDYDDRAPSADEDAYRRRLIDGDPDKEVRKALELVKSRGMGHDDMLEAVTAIVGLGVRGHKGVGAALDAARATYADGWPDAGRSWDNAVAGSVRRLGLPPATIPLSKPERKAIKARNDPKAVEAKKAERKAVYRAEKHKGAIAAASDPDADRPLAGDRVLEDASLADELARVFRGSWAYADGLGIMRYVSLGEAGRWKPAEEHALIEAVRRELVEIEVDEHTAAAMRGDNKAIDKARTLLSRSRASAVARLVLGILAEDAPEFDAHPDLLNTPSGVVDLRTSTLSPADPLLYLSKMTAAPYDPKADMTMWDRAQEALPPEVAAWLKVRLGQALTGYTPDDDVLVIFEGAGENGKTSWMIGVRKALGDYARTLPERLLVADPGDHPTTLMTLMGARLGAIEELPEGRSLNVKRLKDVVGTPEITARKMRQDDITFPNTTCLFLSTNYLPIVAETDHGTWRRLALVRFRETYLKADDWRDLKKAGRLTKRHHKGDPRVKRHFEHKADAGLLAWLVEGAAEWYALGEKMPDKPARVKKDTEAWRLDADPILAYVRERLTMDTGYAITAVDLADDFNLWLERRGHRRWTGQTINSRFQGHVSMDGVERKMVKWSNRIRPSRPTTVFASKPIPKTTTSWRGVRFVDEPRIPSEAELDAATLADLERRATADD